MSQDYGSATINAMPTTAGTVVPPGSPPVQPPIGFNILTAAATEMWNGEIGNALLKVVSAADLTAPFAGNYIATPGTLGRSKLGALMTWCTSVAGAAANATGTITGSVFLVGAGTSVAQGTIAANGGGWVLN